FNPKRLSDLMVRQLTLYWKLEFLIKAIPTNGKRNEERRPPSGKHIEKKFLFQYLSPHLNPRLVSSVRVRLAALRTVRHARAVLLKPRAKGF
ncbi:MAG: hypothetical protein ACP5QS_03700, partial [bacterium]